MMPAAVAPGELRHPAHRRAGGRALRGAQRSRAHGIAEEVQPSLPKCPWPLRRGEELFKVLCSRNKGDAIALATVKVLSCLSTRAEEAVAAWLAVDAGDEHTLLRRVRAALARLSDSTLAAADGSALLRPLAAAELASCAGKTSRWASSLRRAGVAVVALTPAPAAETRAPEPAELYSSVLFLVQRVASTTPSARGDREAAAACGALLRARATALLARRLASPLLGVAEVVEVRAHFHCGLRRITPRSPGPGPASRPLPRPRRSPLRRRRLAALRHRQRAHERAPQRCTADSGVVAPAALRSIA